MTVSTLVLLGTHILVGALGWAGHVLLTRRREMARRAQFTVDALCPSKWLVAGVEMPDPADPHWKSVVRTVLYQDVPKQEELLCLGSIVVDTTGNVFFEAAVPADPIPNSKKYGREVVRYYRQRKLNKSLEGLI